MNAIQHKVESNIISQKHDQNQLLWFEESVLKYLITYFQGGRILVVRKIFEYAKFQIDNIISDNPEDFIILSFLKNISLESDYFKNFLYNWGKKVSLNSVENPLILNNKIKGKILWKNTLIERNFREYPYSLRFICSSYENDFNTLENILIKSFLFFLKETLEKYQKSFNYQLNRDQQSNDKQDWKFYTFSLLNIIRNILNNYYMREITLKKTIWKDSLKLSRALKKSNQTEHMILKFAYHLRRLLVNKDRNLLQKYLEKYLIKPDQNKTAELFVLFSLIEKISSLNDGKIFHKLISPTSESRWILFKEVNNQNIKIYYQKKPKDFLINFPAEKTFSKTLTYYKLARSRFIPDIIIDIKAPDLRRIILIEVKNSENWNYIRTGLLQICNYFDYFEYREKNNVNKNTNFEKVGLLVVRGLPKNPNIEVERINSEYPIKIIKFKELEDLDIKSFL